MAQTVAGTDLVGIAPVVVVVVVPEAGTVVAVAGIAVPGAGSPGTSVTQHVEMVKNLGSVKSFAEAGIAVEEWSGIAAGGECPDLTVEVCPQSAGLIVHQQIQRLAATAAVVVCQK